MPMRDGVTWDERNVPSHPVPYVDERRDARTIHPDVAAALEAEHGPAWRHFIDRPDPRVELRAIRNLVDAGFKLWDDWNGLPKWMRPGGGSVYGHVRSTTGQIALTHFASACYGHWLDPCSSCQQPVDARQYNSERHLCFSCNYWLHTLLTDTDGIIVTSATGQRVRYQDCGNRPNVRGQDRSHLGFGGHVFRFRALDGNREWETNNVFTQGDVPQHLWDQFPPTHEIIPAQGGTP